MARFTMADDPARTGERNEEFEDWLINQTGPDDYSPWYTRKRKYEIERTYPAEIVAGPYRLQLDASHGGVMYRYLAMIWVKGTISKSTHPDHPNNWSVDVYDDGAGFVWFDGLDAALAEFERRMKAAEEQKAAERIAREQAPPPPTISPTHYREEYRALRTAQDRGESVSPTELELASVSAAMEIEEEALADGRMVACPNCGQHVWRTQLMNASTGVGCPDCYDSISD